MKVYRVLFIFIFVTLSGLVNGSLSASTLHAILLLDTLDIEIGKAMEANYRLLQKRLQEIAISTDLSLNLTVIDGVKLTACEYLDEISRLDIREDDVLIIYFSGHGCRSQFKPDPWPFLRFSQDHSFVDYLAVAASAATYKPRLMIVIADCCNNVIAGIAEKDLVEAASTKKLSKKEKNLHRLFREEAKWIFVTSSSPGEYAWAWVEHGSCYTISLIGALFDEVKKSNDTSWESVLCAANRKLLSQKMPSPQTPFWTMLPVGELPWEKEKS